MLIRKLDEELGYGHALTLLRSERAMTDCRPVSLFSLQTGRRLGEDGVFRKRTPGTPPSAARAPSPGATQEALKKI